MEIYLRSFEEPDLDRLMLWRNDPELYDQLLGVFRHTSRAVETDWLRKVTIYSPTAVNWAVCLLDGGRHVGNLYLRDIDWVHRHAELHIFIGEIDCRGRGVGTQAVRKASQYAFGVLGLRRLTLQVLFTNAAAVHVYEKCGFVREGLLREHCFKQGRWVDVVVMGLLADAAALAKQTGSN